VLAIKDDLRLNDYNVFDRVQAFINASLNEVRHIYYIDIEYSFVFIIRALSMLLIIS
jgi:hypothetical protein